MRDQLTIPLPAGSRRQLDIVALKGRMSVSEFVRHAINDKLVTQGEPALPPMSKAGRPKSTTHVAAGESVPFGSL